MNANQMKTGLELREDLGTWGSQPWYDVFLCGRNMGATVGYSRSVERLRACANHTGVDLKAARLAYLEALKAVAAQMPAPVESTQPEAPRARCPHYKAIRRAFAICKERGLDTKNDSAMRRAFENFLMRPLPSRDALTGNDWLLVGDAIKNKEIAW